MKGVISQRWQNGKLQKLGCPPKQLLSWQTLSEATILQPWSQIKLLQHTEWWLMKKEAGHWLTREITERRLQWSHITRNKILTKENLEKLLNKLTAAVLGNNSSPWGGGRIWFPKLPSIQYSEFSVLNRKLQSIP